MHQRSRNLLHRPLEGHSRRNMSESPQGGCPGAQRGKGRDGGSFAKVISSGSGRGRGKASVISLDDSPESFIFCPMYQQKEWNWLYFEGYIATS
jgi:hypothetical protein